MNFMTIVYFAKYIYALS